MGFDPTPSTLKVWIANEGALGVHLQARSLTVTGAPYSYTAGAGDRLAAQLPNPGTYDLSLHGPNGFYRHYGGSPSTALTVTEELDHGGGRVTLKISDPGKPLAVRLSDAYGADRQLRVSGSTRITVETHDTGGWYDSPGRLVGPALSAGRHWLLQRQWIWGILTSLV